MASLGDLYNDLKTLCKQWFYDKTEADGRFSPKKLSDANYFVLTDSSKELTTQQKLGNIDKNGAIGGTANLPLITTSSGVITTGSFGTSANTFCQGNDSRLSDARTPTSHNQATSTITNSTAFDHIKSGESTTLTLDTQAKINDAINTKLGTLMEADIVVVTDNKGTASASTMNKLYLEAKSGGASGDGYNIWITVRTGTSPNYSYAWEKVDDFDLQTLSVAWANVTGKPASAFGTTSGTFAEGNHTHNTDDVELTGNQISELTNIADQNTENQTDINENINVWIGNLNSALNGKASNNHYHGNILNGGTCTTDVTFNSKILVTNSSDKIGTSTAIDVLDSVVQSLITYGAS